MGWQGTHLLRRGCSWLVRAGVWCGCLDDGYGLIGFVRAVGKKCGKVKEVEGSGEIG